MEWVSIFTSSHLIIQNQQISSPSRLKGRICNRTIPKTRIYLLMSKKAFRKWNVLRQHPKLETVKMGVLCPLRISLYEHSKYIPFSTCKPDNLSENRAALLPTFLGFPDSMKGTWLHIHIPSPHAVRHLQAELWDAAQTHTKLTPIP